MTSKKPIHKFNGGVGATLCHECRAIITEGMTEDLLCDKCKQTHSDNPDYIQEAIAEPIYKYKLVRQDGLTKHGNKVMWIEFGEDDDYYKSHHDEPAVNRSLILDFSGPTFTWMTTTVDEVIENRPDYIKFKTKNSIYELFIQQ
jgi:hypothetical protein